MKQAVVGSFEHHFLGLHARCQSHGQARAQGAAINEMRQIGEFLFHVLPHCQHIGMHDFLTAFSLAFAVTTVINCEDSITKVCQFFGHEGPPIEASCIAMKVQHNAPRLPVFYDQRIDGAAVGRIDKNLIERHRQFIVEVAIVREGDKDDPFLDEEIYEAQGQIGCRQVNDYLDKDAHRCGMECTNSNRAKERNSGDWVEQLFRLVLLPKSNEMGISRQDCEELLIRSSA